MRPLTVSQQLWKSSPLRKRSELNEEFHVDCFKELEALETALYSQICSQKILLPALLSLFEECLKEDPEAGEVLQTWARKPEQIISARLSDAARNWSRYIYNCLMGFESKQEYTAGKILSLARRELPNWSKETCRKFRETLDFKNRIAESHLGLAKLVCGRVLRKNKLLTEEDLQQEGYFGIIRAIEKFDHTKGYRFSTYAVWWLNHAMRRYMDNVGEAIRVPILTSKHRKDILRFQKRYQQEHHCLPSLAEIRQGTGLTQAALDLAMTKFTVSSLDQKFEDDEDDSRSMYDCLEDDHEYSRPEELLQKADLSEQLREALGRLTDKERLIIMERFGLGDRDDEPTLAEVGDKIRLSRERVRQIQDQALKKLKMYLPRM